MMPRWLKLLIGLAAALAAGWIHHGPLGGGERFVDALDARAQLRLKAAELPGVQVRMQRDPLARVAILSGQADEFQKEGLGSFPGINERISSIPGMASIRWEQPGCCVGGRWMPLLAETLILSTFAYFAGLGIGWLLFGRKRRESFLGDEELTP